MPRTGTAAYDIDIFAFSSFPGREPSVLLGAGTFNVDFSPGDFSASGYLEDRGLVTGGGSYGGGIELKSGGHITSGSGRFTGNVLIGTTAGEIAGTLGGRFYGPQAQELGAQFNGTNSAGAALNGAFTGQRAADAAATNLTLTNMSGRQNFYAPGINLNVTTGASGTQVAAFPTSGGLSRLDSQTYTVGPGPAFSTADYTAGDLTTASDPNFTAYRKTIDGHSALLELFKPGPANTQLALTYASFGRWSTVKPSGSLSIDDKVFFAYGFETPARLLSARTGTARYNGVIIGAGAHAGNGNTYDVTGTSRIDVDFTNQSYSGALALQGNGTNGTASADFGSYLFNSKLANYVVETLSELTTLGLSAGELRTRFYGPDGEELAGSFSVKVPVGRAGAGTTVAGAMAARRQ